MRVKLTEGQYKRLLTQTTVSPNLPVLREYFASIRIRSLDYDDLSAQLQGARNGRKLLAKNTYLERIDDHTVGIKYHRTHIVKVDATDTITIDCDGWAENPSTYSRLGDILYCKGIRFSKSKSVLYLHKGGQAYVYEDGIQVLANGDVIMP